MTFTFKTAAKVAYVLILIFNLANGFRVTSTSRQSLRLHMSANQLGRVTVYSKANCPYCTEAKLLLEETLGLSIINVDVEGPNKEEIVRQMNTFSGNRNTVPQIFFNSEHIGGNSDLQKLHSSGQLSQKVEKVKNTAVSRMMDHWYHPWY